MGVCFFTETSLRMSVKDLVAKRGLLLYSIFNENFATLVVIVIISLGRWIHPSKTTELGFVSPAQNKN